MIKKIVLVTNEINPYRKSFYDQIYKYCTLINVNFTVLLMTKVERGYNWNYDKVKATYALLMKGIHFSFPINNYLNIEVLKHLKRIKPDVVIMAGSYFYYTNWLVIAQKKKFGFPIYFWSETHFQEKRNYSSWKLQIREYIRKFLYRKFDGFWYSGKLSREFIEHYANANAKYHFVPNLIDHHIYYSQTIEHRKNKVSLRNKWNIKDDKIILITPARLSWVKGIHTFLDLLKKSKYAKDVVMLIPGTGPDKEKIEGKIAETHLDIRLLGYQQQEVMIELYALADYFVLPSLSDPNPLTCIEALWCGLPLLVSTHVGNYPETIKKGENGYVFDYSNPQEAINIIDKLLSSTDKWKNSARECSLSIASKFYDSEKIVPRLINNIIKENS